MNRPRSGATTRAVMLGVLSLPPALAVAQPPPVAAGLWEVRLLATFRPDPEPGAGHWPGQPDKPRARHYRVCIDAARARSPMMPARLPRDAETLTDRQMVTAHWTLPRADGKPGQVELLYRRIDDRSFEGSHDTVAGGRATSLQYFARHLSADCAGQPPGRPGADGAP